MGYDDVVSHIGEFGRYQRRVHLALCIPAIASAFHEMAGVFLSARTDFRCLLPGENLENATYYLPSDIANISYPWDLETKNWAQCERYILDPADGNNTSVGNPSTSHSTVKCDHFVYDRSQYELTTTTEWNVVCDDAWLRATGDSMFMAGMMLGSLICGGLSDTYGRKVTLVSLLTIQLISGMLVAASPNFIWFMIFRLIVGSSTCGVSMVSCVLVIELFSPKKRLLAQVSFQLSYTCGFILITGLAYLITNWRFLQIAFAVPSIACLAHWWLIPESVRWLLTKGRLEEAKNLLHKAALKNGVELHPDTLDSLLIEDSQSESDVGKPSVFDLFRYQNLRKKTAIICFLWFVNSCTYYGLSWNTSDLEGNEFVNFGISASLEVPAFILMLFTLDKWGRKIVVCSSLLLAGTSLLCTLFVSSDMRWIVVVFAMIGKFAISCANAAVLVFAAEQFPTVIRNAGLGVSGIFNKVGAIMAPYINLLTVVWRPLPLVIFGSCSLIAGLMSLLLPETLHQKLPQSIQDGEQFGKKSKQDTENWSHQIRVTIKPLIPSVTQNSDHSQRPQ